MKCPVDQHWLMVFAHLLGTLKTTSRAWQHEAAFRVEQQFREQQLLLVLSENERVLLHSQSGLGAGSFLTVQPTNPLVRFDSQIFRVLPCPGVSADVAVSLMNFTVLPPDRPKFRSFFLSLGVFSWNFGGVFEGQTRTFECPGASKHPTLAQAARWWPRESNGRLQMRLDMESGRKRRVRNKGGSIHVSKPVERRTDFSFGQS